MREKNFNFWKNKTNFLNNIKSIQPETSNILVYHNLIEENETNGSQIVIRSNYQSKSIPFSKFIQKNSNLTVFDPLEDDFIIKQTTVATNTKDIDALSNIYHFKYLTQTKNNINLFFKLLHVNKFLIKFFNIKSTLALQSVKQQQYFFKASTTLISLLIKKFLSLVLKLKLKSNNNSYYGLVVAVVPFKGLIIYNGFQRFILPMSKIIPREINKITHLKQCLLLNRYLMYNLIKFSPLKSQNNFYKTKHKQYQSIQLVDYQKN